METLQTCLMEKYPTLFRMEGGKMLSPPCGIYAPVGWYKLIDDCCASIVEYQSNNNITVNQKISSRVGYNICKCIHYVLSEFRKFFMPYIYQDTELLKEIANISVKLKSLQYNKFSRFISKPKDPVYICQIKEKFGTLRFYVDGGDEIINGIIRHAEFISSRTCEVTGNLGALCNSRGGWFKTLSPEALAMDRYKSFTINTANE